MNEWSKDARGNLRVSTVSDWKAEAVTADGSGDVVLRVEFSVDPERTDVSSLQFRLTEQQAKSMGAALSSASNQPPQSSDLIYRAPDSACVHRRGATNVARRLCQLASRGSIRSNPSQTSTVRCSAKHHEPARGAQ